MSLRSGSRGGIRLAVLGWAAFVVACAFGVARVRALVADPSVNLLLPGKDGARWIRYPDPFSHVGRPKQEELTLFRKRFDVPGSVYRAELSVEAFESLVVLLDEQTIPTRPFDAETWKQPIDVDLAQSLRPGSHELMLVVRNWNAHAAVRASCPVLGLRTDDGWEASHDARNWTPARSLEEREPLPFPVPLPTAAQAFARQLVWMLPLFAAVAFASILRSKGRLRGWTLTPSRTRWILIGVWVVVGVNDLLKLPLEFGFDASSHLDYVHFVSTRWRLPLARDGWEMYQAPLHYLISAALDGALGLASAAHDDAWLRLVPLACGALQIEVARRVGRRVFEGRDDLQISTIVIAGLLPVNLYMSQTLGNESLCGLATAVLVLLCIGEQRAIWMGVALGVACLSKVTALLWFPLCAVALVSRSIAERASVSAIAKQLAAVWGIAVVIAGWFYARNWMLLGKPFVEQWDWRESNRIWWQDPSYRIPEHFARFGRSLVQPIYAGIDSFWDGMYSTLWADSFLGGIFSTPPWRLEPMIAGAWLGLPLTIAMVAAMTFGSFRASARRSTIRFSTLAVLVYLLAALYVNLRVPVYSLSKASFTLGLTPCYALLAVAGMKSFFDRPWTRAIVCGFLACFAVAAVAAYFVS